MLNEIAIEIMTFTGLMGCVCGVFITPYIYKQECVINSSSKIFAIYSSLAFLFLMFILGSLVATPGILEPYRDITITYDSPTIYCKTNNTVFISYIVDRSRVIDFRSTDAVDVNCDSFMIKIVNGKGFIFRNELTKYKLVKQVEE